MVSITLLTDGKRQMLNVANSIPLSKNLGIQSRPVKLRQVSNVAEYFAGILVDQLAHIMKDARPVTLNQLCEGTTLLLISGNFQPTKPQTPKYRLRLND